MAFAHYLVGLGPGRNLQVSEFLRKAGIIELAREGLTVLKPDAGSPTSDADAIPVRHDLTIDRRCGVSKQRSLSAEDHSRGFQGRVLVEIKLTKNPKLVHGCTKQLAKYADAEETNSARYLVIDVGNAGSKIEDIMSLRNTAAKEGRRALPIDLVDGTRRPSASIL